TRASTRQPCRRCRSSRGRPACSPTSPRSASRRAASSSRAPPRRRCATSPDDAAFREQLAYLPERAPFYRANFAGLAGRGLAEIAELPLTEKHELRATVMPESPFGAHLCADRSELVRVYSTSGTTGTPSFIPLTASDLDNWVTGSARSYAASGLAAGETVVTTYNAGPFVAGAALAAFDRIGATHVPIGTGNTERVLASIERLRPDAIVATPSYAAHLAERA